MNLEQLWKQYKIVFIKADVNANTGFVLNVSIMVFLELSRQNIVIEIYQKKVKALI